MNKKTLIILSVAIGALVAGVAAYMTQSNNNKSQQTTTTNKTNKQSDKQATNIKSACDVFTIEIAKKYLGGNARLGDTVASNKSTDGEHLVTSSCLYDAGEDSLKSLNIQLNTAKSITGEEWNRDNFNNSPKKAAEASGSQVPELTQISGVGEKAYWNPQLGQLQVLLENGKYWLSIQGSIRDTQAEIDQHKSMAQEIINNIQG